MKEKVLIVILAIGLLQCIPNIRITAHPSTKRHSTTSTSDSINDCWQCLHHSTAELCCAGKVMKCCEITSTHISTKINTPNTKASIVSARTTPPWRLGTISKASNNISPKESTNTGSKTAIQTNPKAKNIGSKAPIRRSSISPTRVGFKSASIDISKPPIRASSIRPTSIRSSKVTSTSYVSFNKTRQLLPSSMIFKANISRNTKALAGTNTKAPIGTNLKAPTGSSLKASTSRNPISSSSTNLKPPASRRPKSPTDKTLKGIASINLKAPASTNVKAPTSKSPIFPTVTNIKAPIAKL